MPAYTYNPEHRGHSLRHSGDVYKKGDTITVSEADALALCVTFGLEDLLLPSGEDVSEDDAPPRLGGRPETLPDLVMSMKVKQLHKMVRLVYGGQVKTRGLGKAAALLYLQKADKNDVLEAIENLD